MSEERHTALLGRLCPASTAFAICLASFPCPFFKVKVVCSQALGMEWCKVLSLLHEDFRSGGPSG